MLISYKNKFIFVHNYKVAGSSVKSALRKFGLNTPSRFDKINRFCEYFELLKNVNYYISNKVDFIPSYKFHASAEQLSLSVPIKYWNNYFKFSFVRNPWDLQVSLYFYMKRSKIHFQHELINSMKSFDEYIEWRVEKDFHSQKDFLCDKEGNILVDFVGKLENIEKDFQEICKKLNISVSLPKINTTKHQHYREYYNGHTMELVRKYFYEDINMFNYDF